MDYVTPPGLHPPFARYNHAVKVSPGAGYLFVSGQLAVTPDGVIPDSAEAQADLIFQNIAVILGEACMTAADLVRISAFVSDRRHMQGYMTARDRFVTDPPPASTLMIVSGFTNPQFNVEIEVVAAREP
jgi:enamine deaminase RidA (YjgF/YER057c/UK114 family)